MNLKSNDIRSSVVVFLVALPLCLGIALASGAPLASGIISGIIGGIVIGIFGGSQVSVSGPAAGLATIVAAAILELNGMPAFSMAILLAGLMQLAMGVFKAGELGNYFPASVIKGMLAAIGLILILKQLPHAFGWDADYMGDESFGSLEGRNTFTDILIGLRRFHNGATVVGLGSIALMLFWDKYLTKKVPRISLFPSALAAVLFGVILNEFVLLHFEHYRIESEHLVQLPFTGGVGSLLASLSLPDWSAMSNFATWKVAITIAIVASLESLLSLDAADKIDPLKRTSMKNKELRAQGIGNFLAGLCGALPMTAVIVRTSANVTGGALTNRSAILHGVWLLLAVILAPHLLNRIPLASLAAVLILVGWKLSAPKLFKEQWKLGMAQFIPFTITVVAIILTDLLVGIGIGFLVGIIFVLKSSSRSAVTVVEHNNNQMLIRFSKDVSFLQKPRVRALLRGVANGTHVVIDGSRSIHIDRDIEELIEDFMHSAAGRDINVQLQKSSLALSAMFKE
jgi:MFS superfamily sulfate permease-like transporter